MIPSSPRPREAAGKRFPLIDGIEKVTGRAKYTADLEAGDALVGCILRSPWPHANILSIDTTRARALPGVAAVITGDDCDRPFGVLPIAEDEYPLARGRVRYRGDPVAAVAAMDAKTAAQALNLIEVQAEELPPTSPPTKPKRRVQSPPMTNIRPTCCENRVTNWATSTVASPILISSWKARSIAPR